MVADKKHHVTVERHMRPDPNHPSHLEATDSVLWSCVCGESGTTLEELFEDILGEHPHK